MKVLCFQTLKGESGQLNSLKSSDYWQQADLPTLKKTHLFLILYFPQLCWKLLHQSKQPVAFLLEYSQPLAMCFGDIYLFVGFSCYFSFIIFFVLCQRLWNFLTLCELKLKTSTHLFLQGRNIPIFPCHKNCTPTLRASTNLL